ncbi:CheR family methyltransferase [Wukongibacter sp. M2B1]|uniref:CheR family methyltransferase n=1 Tax=Wukongibacter sp. M2B1 TaxID=3088895 RepID=UPI003D7B21E6
MIDKESVLEIANEDIEISLLLEAIYQKYGYDFRNYSREHIKRRIKHRLVLSNIDSISQMQYRVLYDSHFFRTLLRDFSINVTEMFRDPSFYRAIREDVIPVLKTYPFIKIWHAGCSTGEEVYSMAILLKEEGLYDKAQIYATDFNKNVLKKAKEGIYSIDNIRKCQSNYFEAGGGYSFSDYYISKYNSVIFHKYLKEKVIFADHNLVTDGVFGEMNMIICRNVLIYFNNELQNHVIKLFYDSLCYGGFLGLGSKESIRFTNYYDKYEPYVREENIFRKKFGD